MKRIVFLLIFLNLLPSCIPLWSTHGAAIDKLQSQVAIGSTTREEVISILGKPDLARERYIIYLKREYDGGYLVYPVGCPGHVNVANDDMDIFFEFDKQGILTNYRMDKYVDLWDKKIKDDKGDSKVEEDCDPGTESCA